MLLDQGPLLSTLSSSAVSILPPIDSGWSGHEVFLFFDPQVLSSMSKSLGNICPSAKVLRNRKHSLHH